MITFDFTQPYPALAAVLFVVSGGLLLWVDVKSYDRINMTREKKWSRFLGYLNVSLGVLLFVAGWVYSQWVW